MKKGIDFVGVAVGALLINDKEEVLLLKRSQQARNYRGHWEAPGGSVDFNETLEQAAKREVMEEIGIEVDIVRQLPAADEIIPEEKQHWVSIPFLVKSRSKQEPKILEPEKADDMQWFSLDNLPTPMSPVTQGDIEKYKEL